VCRSPLVEVGFQQVDVLSDTFAGGSSAPAFQHRGIQFKTIDHEIRQTLRPEIRLFVVFAVCWYIGSAVFLWPQWTAAIKAERAVAVADLPAGYKLDPDSFMEQQKAIEAARASRPMKASIVCSLLPPSLYGFVSAVFWVVRGFRRDAKSG
jgi:hypothetical protein